MSKIDYEKDRRRRLPKDICADAPWHNDDASVVARVGPRIDHSLSDEHRGARQKSPVIRWSLVPRLTHWLRGIFLAYSPLVP